MPIYAYKCPNCRTARDVYKKLAELDREEHCYRCGAVTSRVVTAPMVLGDYEGYSCPVTGKWVEGRRAHKENLARTGCRLREPGEGEENARRRKSVDDAFDASVETTVDRFIETLPSDKKARLGAEIEAGLDVAVQRS